MTDLVKRACGECTACCKTHAVNEIKKLEGVWCTHCNIGIGCRIYETRPDGCKTFKCQWLMGFGGPELRPDKSGIVITHSKAILLQITCRLAIVWEYYVGTLETPFARALTEELLSQERMTFVGHFYLFGRKRIFLPERVRLTSAAREAATRMNLEVIEKSRK